ncbi:MAG TPA: ATP-grasp domain-containing protein [Candidatus Avidesulfovibrio excrementigallinarum]|nr:ATP-grasp domain-containing protein [Candidatus Avidesulfovibrio excrementigallinarum]
MIVLDRPYVSDHLLDYLAASGQAVLATPFTRALAAGRALNLVDDAGAIRRCRAGERLYTSSENALDWVLTHLGDLPLARHVAVMKDKAALRRTLAPLCPGFWFREVPATALAGLDVTDWPKPFVIKPSVGFFSLGVHTVASMDDWRAAVAAIEKSLHEQRQTFPASVVDQSAFLLEAYIRGDEFAVDVYFDSQGEPVILNIFAHRFASLSDVSDRLYYTSKDVIERNKPRFEAFFRQANALMGVKDFPAHVELRVQGERILPIEFNALRFAGLCTTDLADLAYGINTIDCYLNDRRPDFDTILRGREGKTYSMIILDKPASLPPSSRFDYDALAARFQRVLELRRLDSPDLPVFGFLFTETDTGHADQLDAILRSDLTEFLR